MLRIASMPTSALGEASSQPTFVQTAHVDASTSHIHVLVGDELWPRCFHGKYELVVICSENRCACEFVCTLIFDGVVTCMEQGPDVG